MSNRWSQGYEDALFDREPAAALTESPAPGGYEDGYRAGRVAAAMTISEIREAIRGSYGDERALLLRRREQLRTMGD